MSVLMKWYKLISTLIEISCWKEERHKYWKGKKNVVNQAPATVAPLNESEFASLQVEHYQSPLIWQEVVVLFYELEQHYQVWRHYVHKEDQDYAYAWGLHKAVKMNFFVKTLAMDLSNFKSICNIHRSKNTAIIN